MASNVSALASFDAAIGAGVDGVQRIVGEAINLLRRTVTLKEVDAALEARTAALIFESEPWRSFREALAGAFGTQRNNPLMRSIRSAVVGAVENSPIDPSEGFYEDARELSELWLARHGAVAVQGIDEKTRAALRVILANAYSRDASIKSAARSLWRSRAFGVDPRQAGALITLRAELSKTRGRRSVDRMIRSVEARMLRERAELIAQTEATAAAAAGFRETWRLAVQDRLLDGAAYEVQWLTRKGDTCPRCIALSKRRALIDGGSFTSETVKGGGRFNGTQVVIERPPVHPRCYCALRLVKRVER